MRRAAVVFGCLLAACGDGRSAKERLEESMSGAALGEEREVSPGAFMTMYRVRSGDAPTGEWQRATSTRGGFSVELPVPFNDFRMRTRAEDGATVYADAVGGKTPGLLSYLATCTARADGKRDPAHLASTDQIEHLGDPVRAWARSLPTPTGACVIVVEAQGSDPLPDQATIDRFLRSFQPAPAAAPR